MPTIAKDFFKKNNYFETYAYPNYALALYVHPLLPFDQHISSSIYLWDVQPNDFDILPMVLPANRILCCDVEDRAPFD